jgi:exodeoxyribonuclease-5
MTAHKSQGSTFENVFVDVQNIWRNPNKEEAMQCLYVACSRASHHLILNASGL